MNEMIETVARAIYEKRNGTGCKPWPRLPRSHQDPYRSDARAAIEAMRDPTEAMWGAVIDSPAKLRRSDWRDMIDAALNEEGQG